MGIFFFQKKKNKTISATLVSSGGLEPSVIRNHIPPTSLTCNVESKVAEDDWELDLIWFVVARYLKTRLEQACGCIRPLMHYQ